MSLRHFRRAAHSGAARIVRVEAGAFHVFLGKRHGFKVAAGFDHGSEASDVAADIRHGDFREVLADVAEGQLSVDMVADPVKGNMAVIGVADAAGARSEVEAKINERMKAFATPYTVRWTG